ncbi:collagen alpha-1(I) chain-like [Leopardus geoffroyi]|uniref:collagen alpha-1(I) chain-like n=1 Tax=Leopardus geoffroyi TaxID=46844 RepID=UPI001E260F3D|nr:collagen alpha-1(I) chain-like [Leopardus geoffroyi]
MVVSTWRAVTYIIQPLRPAALKPARRPPGRARALRGVLLSPEITCFPFQPPPGSLGARVWRGRAFRKTFASIGVCFTFHSKEAGDPRAEGSGGNAFGENRTPSLGTRLSGLEKFRAGREGWESPLLAPGASGAAWPAATSRSPPPSRPFLFRRGPALGVAASRPRDPEREVRRRRRRPGAPSGGHAPAARAAPGGPARPARALRPPPLPEPPPGPEPLSAGPRGAHAGRRGQPPAPRAARGSEHPTPPGPRGPAAHPPAPPPQRPRSATARLLLRGPFQRRRARTRGRAAPPGRRGPPRGPKEGRGRLKGWTKPPLLSTPFLLSIKDIWPLPPASPFFGVSSPGCEFRGDGKPFLQKLPIRPVKPAGQKVLFKKGTTRRKKRSTFPGQKSSLALEPSWSGEGGMRVACV